MNYLLFPLLLIFFSCASHQEYFHASYFVPTPGSEGATLPYAELYERLTRRLSMAGGLYQISLTPLTAPLLEAQVKDMAQWKNLSDLEIKAQSEELKKLYLDGKTCIQYNAQVIRFEAASKTSAWKIKILTDLVSVREGEIDIQEKAAKKFELTWITPIPNVVKSQIIKIHDKFDQWLLSGVACTYRQLPLEKGFAVKVIAPYINFPFSEEGRVDFGNWSNYDDDKFKNEKQDNDIPSSSSKVKSQNSQRYRGY